MSKDVSIFEGRVSKTFGGVKKIQLKNSDGSSSYWVPEDETTLGTKHISENGEYIASEEKDESGVNRGWYGYEKVTVSGIKKASGKANEGDVIDGNPLDPNDDYEFERDENTGKIKAKRLPYYIKFDQEPTKKNYTDGEDISLEGARVRAYYYDNTPWEGDATHENGYIPLAELTLEPTKADISAVLDEFTIRHPTISGEESNAVIRVKSLTIGIIKSSDNFRDVHWNPPTEFHTFLATFIGDTIIFVKNDGSTIPKYKIWFGTGSGGQSPSVENITIDGKETSFATFGVSSGTQLFLRDEFGYPTTDKDELTIGQVAWAIANSSGSSKIGTQEISVKWSRSDGNILRTEFNIQVQAAEEEEDDDNGGWLF